MKGVETKNYNEQEDKRSSQQISAGVKFLKVFLSQIKIPSVKGTSIYE